MQAFVKVPYTVFVEVDNYDEFYKEALGKLG